MENYCQKVNSCAKKYVQLNYLNENVANDFFKINCTDNACLPTVYTSNDPRLVSSAHSGQRLLLDSVPQKGNININSVSNEHGFFTGPKQSYSNIKDGDVIYYYDNQLATPFISQLFESNPNKHVIKQNYIDPNGVCKPHYLLTSKCFTKKCLNLPSWLRDSQYHREDLLSKQLWNRNQSSFEVNQNMQCVEN